jgi:hypothetical protein
MAVTVMMLVGCSPATETTVKNDAAAVKQAVAPVEPIPAKTAFWPLYTAARNWAPDVVLLRLTSKDVPGFKMEDGKAAMWEATFASPSQRGFRLDTYAITDAPGVHKGVDTGIKAPWGGVTRDDMPIDTSNFNIDSDAAYTAAAADAATWLKSNPDKKLTSMQLGNLFKFHTPVWYVMWGDPKTGGYGAYVDANTGKVLKK